jgi:hypothetical protein
MRAKRGLSGCGERSGRVVAKSKRSATVEDDMFM